LNKGTRNLLAYGTDGEEELARAMKFNFPLGIHLRCFNHFRENCKAKLNKSKIPENDQKDFLYDIFGRRIGDIWENGMLSFQR
jgi:transposase-like protein